MSSLPFHICASLGDPGETPACGVVPCYAISVQDKSSGRQKLRAFQKSPLSLESEGPDLAFLGFPHPFWLIFSPRDEWCSGLLVIRQFSSLFPSVVCSQCWLSGSVMADKTECSGEFPDTAFLLVSGSGHTTQGCSSHLTVITGQDWCAV